MISVKDIAWLAGLLEGEGCFGYYKNHQPRGAGIYYQPRIVLSMADKDVVEHAAALLNVSVCLNHRAKKGRKELWNATATGARAIAWMMTLYSLLGERRRARIREIISAWKIVPTRTGCSYYRRRRDSACS